MSLLMCEYLLATRRTRLHNSRTATNPLSRATAASYRDALRKFAQDTLANMELIKWRRQRYLAPVNRAPSLIQVGISAPERTASHAALRQPLQRTIAEDLSRNVCRGCG
jgi:hypothetical protein